ncbi:hypothetical protein ADIS_0129 [Lunatimonas lonarensis]|uniref:Uncharacterized protein n=1 Tax=Lunatimonas lonarensis TaxID=1232681 RepID=R7ZZ00_9BACT|nr:hypothetical protein ADIS_0129 [Lunatimonas lonarensis]
MRSIEAVYPVSQHRIPFGTVFFSLEVVSGQMVWVFKNSWHQTAFFLDKTTVLFSKNQISQMSDSYVF